MHLLKAIDEQERGITLYRGNSWWALKLAYWMARWRGVNDLIMVMNGSAAALDTVEQHFPEVENVDDAEVDHACIVCGKPAEGYDVCVCTCPVCGVGCFDDVTIADHGECYDCHQVRLFGGLKDEDEVADGDA